MEQTEGREGERGRRREREESSDDEMMTFEEFKQKKREEGINYYVGGNKILSHLIWDPNLGPSDYYSRTSDLHCLICLFLPSV